MSRAPAERGLPNFRLSLNESVPLHAIVRLDSAGYGVATGFEWPERSAEYVVRVFAAMHATRVSPRGTQKHVLLPSFASSRFRLNVTAPLQLTVGVGPLALLWVLWRPCPSLPPSVPPSLPPSLPPFPLPSHPRAALVCSLGLCVCGHALSRAPPHALVSLCPPTPPHPLRIVPSPMSLHQPPPYCPCSPAQVKAPGTARAGDVFTAGVVAQVHNRTLLGQRAVATMVVLTPDLVSCSPCATNPKASCSRCSSEAVPSVLDGDKPIMFQLVVHKQSVGLARMNVTVRLGSETVGAACCCVSA